MRAGPKGILHSLDQIKDRLNESGLLYSWNGSVIERLQHGVSRVTWATSGTRPELSDISTSNIKEYLQFLEGRHFQFMLVDGALIQISYDIRNSNHEVKQSRLVWYPCPVEFSQEELEMFSLSEIILSSPVETLSLQAPLRFDFAPHQAGDNHSTSHLHLGRENFRMPIQRAMEPSRFIRFIIRTAYPNIWAESDIFRESDDWGFGDTLTEDDQRVGALSWHLQVAARVGN